MQLLRCDVVFRSFLSCIWTIYSSQWLPESCYSMDHTESLSIHCNVEPNSECKPISVEAGSHEGKNENHEVTVCC